MYEPFIHKKTAHSMDFVNSPGRYEISSTSDRGDQLIISYRVYIF